MGKIYRTLDSGSGGTEATDIIQCINGRESQIHVLWCLYLDGISREVHPTEYVEVTAGSVSEFVNDSFLKMDAKSISSGNFTSTKASNFWVCPTKPGAADFCLFPICWITLRPQGGEVVIVPIKIGEVVSTMLTALQMSPGVIPLMPFLLTRREVLLTYTPPDVTSTATLLVAGNKSFCGANIIGAIPWSIPELIDGGKTRIVQLLNNFCSKLPLLV